MQQHPGTKGAIAEMSTPTRRLAFSCGSAAVSARHMVTFIRPVSTGWTDSTLLLKSASKKINILRTRNRITERSTSGDSILKLILNESAWLRNSQGFKAFINAE
jgi:hypothetical protein